MALHPGHQASTPSAQAPTRRSIRARLTLIYNIVAILIVGVTWTGGLGYEFFRERERVEQHLASQATMLSANATAAITFADTAAARDILASLRYLRAVKWALIVDQNDQVLASYGEPTPQLPQWLAAFGSRDVVAGLHLIQLRQRVVYDSKVVGTLLIEASFEEPNRQFLMIFAASLIIILLVIALGNRLFAALSRSITDPINSLISVSRRVSETGDFQHRVTTIGPDELGQLSHDFNGMLASLEDRENALRAELAERTRVQAKLDNLAHFDQVTELPNRHYFIRRLQMAVEKSLRFEEPVGLLFIDLDNFKYVNDTLGHQSGDRLLAEVGQRLSRGLRTNDMVARIGGDEFAIILENPKDETLETVAAKIIQALRAPIQLEQQEVVVSASIGVARCPQDTRDQRTLVRYADAAMYSAKESGKNRWAFYSSDMSERNSQRLEMESRMRRGIRDGEFILYYQPVVDSRSGRVESAEALVRWQHPERGLIYPAEFIGLAEDSGLIVPLGEAIITTACQQLRQWTREGLAIPKIALNVSGRQIEEAGFVSRLLNIIQNLECSTSQICIELTESTLMTRHERVMAALGQMHDAGLTIAIDDFGTGYSSMAYLKNFPVGKLKIDRSFINDITRDPQDLAITTAMIALGRGLNLNVIAEGVEDQAQVDTLHTIGCTSIQGYFYSPPLAADDFSDYCLNAGNHARRDVAFTPIVVT